MRVQYMASNHQPYGNFTIYADNDKERAILQNFVAPMEGIEIKDGKMAFGIHSYACSTDVGGVKSVYLGWAIKKRGGESDNAKDEAGDIARELEWLQFAFTEWLVCREVIDTERWAKLRLEECSILAQKAWEDFLAGSTDILKKCPGIELNERDEE
jgi:hypothetical protein